MKKVIIIAIFSIFVYSGCEDNLDLVNPNAPTTTSYWNSPEEAEKGLNAVYHQLYQIGNYSRWIFFRYDLASDEAYSNSPWTELKEWTRFQYVNYNFWEGGSNIWSDHYKAIYRANQVIAHVPDIEFEDQNRKDQIIGEAKFLRALHYFNLAVLWEDVPIVLEPSNPDDQPEQSSQEEVWAQVKKDLTEASEVLPPEWPDNWKGKPTKGAALALLGKANMQTHDWAAAKSAMEWLVEGNGKQYYGLVDNYKDNFTHLNENNIESVFEIQFSDVNRGGKGNGSNSNLACERAQFFAPRGIGWSDGQPRKWLIDEYKKEMNLDGGYDTRLKNNYFYREMSDDFDDNEMVYGGPWREGQWGDDVFFRKYENDYWRNFEDYYSPINFRVIRYADVLLCYAEILNEINNGPTALAIECVDRVRQRPSTNLAKLENSMFASALDSKDAFLKRLQMERSLELCFEAVRWMDLKRWGLLETQEGIDELKQRDPDFEFFEVGRTHRLPIPQIEVENNPNLQQNDPY